MKKIIIYLISIFVIVSIFSKENYIIPEESIRFRVISSSNSKYDLNMKEKTVKEISDIIQNISKDNINDTRKSIINNIDNISNSVKTLYSENDYNKDFKIKYGLNDFPEKEYKGIKYKAGKYESLVIEIGESKGNNYWCVLYPPLCLIDENTDKIEYKSKVMEIIKKYF